MATSASSPAPLDPAFASTFRREAGEARALRFDAFMRLALYHPELGYYRRERQRVGRDRAADFYTATSLGPIFGALVAAAAAKLLRDAGLDPAAHAFVEIGAEPSGGVLAGGVAHPFASVKTLRVGDALELAGACVVFSNELFDAQPVRRFRREAGGWRELGVALDDGAAALRETDLGEASADARAFLPPAEETPEGYVFDAPAEAAALAARLAREPWHGLFIAFDYGKTLAELAHATPAGTARAYHRHAQSNDLLAAPGEQDLTAHVCWDWLAAALAPRAPAERAPLVQSQESFFMHHASEAIAAVLSRGGSSLSKERQALMHLLHPAQMGQKFQVLHALLVR